jgi:hypothetical protein
MHAVGVSLDGETRPLIVHAAADSYLESAGAAGRIASGEITMDG